MLEQLRELGVLSPLDGHFARSVARIAGEGREEVMLAAALASRYTRAGHVCVSLPGLEQRMSNASAATGAPPSIALPDLKAWLPMLRSSALVGEGDAPLVLDAKGRLYLERYWRYEGHVATDLHLRASAPTSSPSSAAAVAALARLFPNPAGAGQNPTRNAAEGALHRKLTVITGGPGTGKTSTVLKLLAVLVEERQATGKAALRATLLAPTGKAAARLSESIRAGKAALPCAESVKIAIPESSSTIHRALGWMSDRPTRFRRDSENPLDTDLVVVDEASMVDLALLSKLLAAIPKDAQLILLGDEDQLSSVEVGAILGDICRSSRRSEPSAAPIAECIFRLEQSHRFGADSAIGALAGAIRSGDSEAALEVLLDPSQTDARLEPSPDSVGLPASLRQLVLTHYPAYLAAAEPESRAKAFGQFRILCAHRAGLRGVEAANRDVERVLASAGLLSPKATWYHGQPIMVRENDYDLELYNGDTGFISLDADGEVRAHFVSGDGRLRSWNPARLPSHDTVFAMTIHKSQGSEMDHVGILLPNQVSPVLSRELLYTAITRAKQTVRVFAPPKVIRAAIDLPVQRASGLTDRLWNTPGAEVDRSPDNS